MVHGRGSLLDEGFGLPRHDSHGRTAPCRLETPRCTAMPVALASAQGMRRHRISHAWQNMSPQRGHKSIGVPPLFSRRCAIAAHILPRPLSPGLVRVTHRLLSLLRGARGAHVPGRLPPCLHGLGSRRRRLSDYDTCGHLSGYRRRAAPQPCWMIPWQSHLSELINRLHCIESGPILRHIWEIITRVALQG